MFVLFTDGGRLPLMKFPNRVCNPPLHWRSAEKRETGWQRAITGIACVLAVPLVLFSRFEDLCWRLTARFRRRRNQLDISEVARQRPIISGPFR